MESDIFPRLLVKQLSNCRIEGFQLYDEIPLGRENAVIGRPVVGAPDPKPNIRILGESSISRRHAEISFDQGANRFSICDLDSTWGTYLNDRRLEGNVSYSLEDGDRIEIVRHGRDPSITFIYRSQTTTNPPGGYQGAQSEPANQNLNFDKLSGILYVNGVAQELSGKELKLLTFLYQNKGIVCRNEVIALEVWGVKWDYNRPENNKSIEDSIRQYILKLRKKIDPKPSKTSHIVHVPNGYRLDA